MRVVHCVHDLALGGAQKTAEFIIRGSRAGDVEHFVYTSRDGVLRKGFEDAGATVRVIGRTVPKFDPIWAMRLARAMKRDRIDLVHTHMFGDCLHGYMAARLAGGIPVVMTLHSGAEARTEFRRRGFRYLMPRVAYNAASSSSVGDFFRDLATQPVQIDVVVNGIAVPTLAPLENGTRQRALEELGVGEASIVLATVGRLVPEKGYTHLLDAFAGIAAGNDAAPKLMFIGDGPLRAELASQAQRLGVGDRVVFAGFRPNVLEALRAADVFVTSSVYEGFPLAVLEAMAAARPIVATDIPGNLDAVGHEREALVVRAGDAAAMTAALERVIGDADLRARLGSAAETRFRAEFTAERMADRYEAIYRKILAV